MQRCNSIESIIHQSPEGSPESWQGGARLGRGGTWGHQLSLDQRSSHHARLARSLEEPRPRAGVGAELVKVAEGKKTGGDVKIEVGSSTDDDVVSSFSEDDEHVFYKEGTGTGQANLDDDNSDELPDGLFDEDDDDDDDEVCGDPDEDEDDEGQLSSQDWEVQLLARQLAEDQRGFARRVDRDIAEGRLDSALAELHEALATDNLGPLTEDDLVRLEKVSL